MLELAHAIHVLFSLSDDSAACKQVRYKLGKLTTLVHLDKSNAYRCSLQCTLIYVYVH